MSGASPYEPWGRWAMRTQRGIARSWNDALLPARPSLLPYGQGRSYGDVAQNSEGALLDTRFLDRLIAFDASAGTLRAESGIRLSDIHRVTAPKGWYLPVVPGTQHVSLGGAIANDVHGKNHHRSGTFGEHVTRLELVRTDGARIECSPAANRDWFRATVGGLGLTGLIAWAEVKLRRVDSGFARAQTLPFSSVAEFAALCEESDPTHEFTVAWFDCFSYRAGRFRGLFTRANLDAAQEGGFAPGAASSLAVPVTPPFCLLAPLAMRAFNLAYFAAGRARGVQTRRVPLEGFFYPLDRIDRWNLLYGPQGFMQLQCAVPSLEAVAATNALLDAIAAARQGTFLAVLKRFSAREAPGLLSFPIEGLTLALDIPFRGGATRALFERCHAIVRAHGGRLYPAKDACMTASTFEAGFPQWREMIPYLDPGMGSDFWRRVTGGASATFSPWQPT